MNKSKILFNRKYLKPIIDFGKMPLGNGFVSKYNKKKEYVFNLKLGFNDKLKLVQIYDYPSPKKMFNKNYAFLSSTSKSMKLHFKKYAQTLKKKLNKKNFKIMEVGCNDGILLENFEKYQHIGIEPSLNVCRIAKNKGLNVINKFFNRSIVKSKHLNKKFDIICGANVFCHIPDLHEMFFTLKMLLNKDGIISIEEPYLGDMIRKISYDQIYDEHIFIFSITSISKIASIFNLELFDAEKQNTHGGSMRYYLCHKRQKKKSKRLLKLFNDEKKLGLDNFKKIKKFEINCIASKNKLKKKIKELSVTHEIYGYGATSKSTTILNFCGIGKKEIKGIFDTSYTKIGKMTPVTHIPILNYKKSFNKIKPKVCILFAWNHAMEICDKEKLNLKNGMKFVCHIDKKFIKPKKFFV